MKLINWIRFSWDLAGVAPRETDLPPHYEIAPAKSEDEKELRKVISSAFLLDPDWNLAIRNVMETVDEWLRPAFVSETTTLLSLRHGARIIGAAVILLDGNADSQLAPGPCILPEYRNRGFGTHLLQQSLLTLRDAGFAQAFAIAKENAPATKFLYTKFDGAATPCDFTPLLAA